VCPMSMHVSIVLYDHDPPYMAHGMALDEAHMVCPAIGVATITTSTTTIDLRTAARADADDDHLRLGPVLTLRAINQGTQRFKRSL
jgi:hypothetical protein